MNGLYNYNYKYSYKKQLQKGRSQQLMDDLLQLDTIRDTYAKLYAADWDAYQKGEKAYEGHRVVTTGFGDDQRWELESAGFVGSSELQRLKNQIEALEYYDARMPEAAKTRQAQRELDNTRDMIRARREDEARRRDELMRLRLEPKDVKTSQQGVLGE